MKTAFFIDGYNLFYGLLANTPYKWLDLPALLSHVTSVENSNSETHGIYYFSSPVKPELASRGIQSKEAQDSYIRALKIYGVSVELGRHTLEPAKAPVYLGPSTRPSRQEKVDIWKLEEKETDVNLAVSLYRTASKQQHLPQEDRIEQIVLVSADTDIGPALQAVREDFPHITIGVILPHREGIKRGAPGTLRKQANWMRSTIKNEELATHQLPDKIPTKKKPIFKPDYW
ncbi:NYN domain-containing protein [Marinomonas sp. A79]|uniref:NYN domain-containing protein n=1 Tax=Marinomonas vulgaris TaxID=2823372 RepID=A0ABS5HHH7_9GAMM|nr:NYN domain-containing protein [Marinomonas vulgaris]MBR7890319.1 NYN domain-containing protein [Marinomonas vulgaris]